MYNSNSIDVVIPSFRLDERILLDIFNVNKPDDFLVNFYIIADNPGLEVPEKIRQLAAEDKINLIINETNLGFSETRNKGIKLGNSKWILLLDDDVIPEKTLIVAYAEAISRHPEALGFAGVTNFPEAFDAVTLALEINGNTGHSKGTNANVIWVPTTNIMLNRESLDSALFNEKLRKGGEDIEFLVRNALLNNKKYITVSNAIVEHPWWLGGTTRRLFRYGAGAAQIAPLRAIRKYTYHSFTNTSETLLLLILFSPVILLDYSKTTLLLLALITIGAEFIVNCIRSVYLTGKFSLGLAANLFWIKNCYEAGYLSESLLTGRPSGFGERIDLAFTKENPSWFRLNRWRIMKTILLLMLFIIVLL